jgi:hypothetical protein
MEMDAQARAFIGMNGHHVLRPSLTREKRKKKNCARAVRAFLHALRTAQAADWKLKSRNRQPEKSGQFSD